MAAEDDIFDSEVPAQTTEGVSPEAPAQNRAPNGQFAAKDEGEAAPVEPGAEGAPPAPAEKQSVMVPLATVLVDREKRQRAESERDQLRRQLAELQQRQQPVQMPDPMEDAQGFTQSLEARFQHQLDNQEANLSEYFARKDHGDDAVNAALEAAQAANVAQHFTRGVDRWHRLVQWHKDQLQFAERSSPDFEANLRERLRAEIMAEMGQIAPSQPSARVPRSLATAPAASGAPPVVSGDPLFD